jgi:hypothetical protein
MNSKMQRMLPGLLLLALACDTTAPASPPPQYAPPAARPAPPPPPAAEAPPDSEIQQTVARVSLVAGGVSFSRGDDPDNWGPADVNVPMTLGDRAWTGDDGRLELQVHGGNLARLSARTDLQALNLQTDVKQFSLSLGTASFSIRRLGDNEVFEVDTPNAAVTFERPGDYRIDVNEGGDTRVQVRRGRAITAAGGGQVALSAGQAMEVEGAEAPRYDIVALPREDGWDRWVQERDQRLAQARSYTYVTADIAGVEDLDQYGRWQQIPDYGWAWTPVSVEAGWAPYRAGRWIWQDPWGWTWVAAEPWGWAPYHYGRWALYGSSWYWVPVAPTVPVVAYSPALVAFVGGGGGYVGWFPLAPRDPYYPWWRRGPTVNVTNVTYVNRTYITVVNQTTFVSGHNLTRDYVRDRSVIRQVEAAPVLRGPVNVIPTLASIRMGAEPASAARPPAAVTTRSVVTRSAPAPQQPRFDSKVGVIRQNGGAPVTASEAARLTAQQPAQPVSRSRPVANDSGRVTLVPKNESPQTARPEPVSPAPGRGSGTAPATRPTPGGSGRPVAQPVVEPVDRSTPPPTAPRPIQRNLPPPTARPAESSRPAPAEERHRPTAVPAPEGSRPTPYVRPTPAQQAVPQSPANERAQAPPPPRERAQPAERVAPAQTAPPRERSAPRPTPTKKPK